MSYIRVIPRDLFNEANLLKCMGQLYIALENTANCLARYDVEDVEYFDIRQNSEDGSIYVANISFSIAGRLYDLSRPLNSRQAWPLYLSNLDDADFDPIAVFDEAGNLSAQMLALVSA